MKMNNPFYKYLLLVITVLLVSCLDKNQENKKDLVTYIDPQIGGVAPFLQPTRTRIHRPNSMVRMYPDRKDYRDDQIRSFPFTTRKHRANPIFNVLPVSGDVDKQVEPVSAWDQELEVAKPYYYSTWLEDYNITVEYSPHRKSGFFRFTFKEDTESKQLFLKHLLGGDKWERNKDGSIQGVEIFEGMKAYAYAELSASGEFLQVKSGDILNSWIQFDNNSEQIISLKYGISFISVEQAKKNLNKEIPHWNFNKVKEEGHKEWSKITNQIVVEGGTEAYKRTFYTALYRSYERMVNISEDGKYYSNYDGKLHQGEKDFYVDDWVWDTFLALHPLRYIFNPEMESDMIDSYVRMYEQWGWLPQFPQLHGETRPMNGFHSTIMILDAWRKGVRGFDIEMAYEAIRKNAFQQTMVAWKSAPACELDTFYAKKGYFPALHPGEKETVSLVDDFEKRQAVAVTLAHSYDDWALAELAKELGKEKDYLLFSQRAKNYKNLYWKEKGFFMPKDKDGNWIDIDPKFDGGMGGRDYYDENNGWTYLWNVQHDLEGLKELMGGTKAFEERLDQHFREDLGRTTYELNARFPDFTGIVGQFSMGNEPSFHIPYLYNYTNSPWKTQKKIRMLLNTWFKDNIFGIPGDEDGGGMSAFVVFSAMGFYPITPGKLIYTIGSPLFSKITMNLPNGKQFIISAPKCNETNKYIQSAKLNGKLLNTPWFSHSDLINGGVLELEMGAYPNKKWGVKK
ncbi:GH92 family glycosyl hydrolase [Ochrovirga pacifica]|uniref:GH92 family glycosyl hydrolase n=1 Tax=Ochrovirga pacifica TaxID=1042376 RepID=UPI000255A54F|nr:GH92 family glycosyl hydrolase [Ochrovirga pacifica]